MGDKSPEMKPEFSRRFLITSSAIAMGALATGLIAHNLIPKNAETDIERSAEFSAEPTWSQEFDTMTQTTVDSTIWRYETSAEVPAYNDESQAYTDWAENVRIEPGVGLVLEARRRAYQYPGDTTGKVYEFTSGRIDTLDSFSFEYGKVEATIKLPEGTGVWPAFWLLSGNEVHTQAREFSPEEKKSDRYHARNGEIDIMEYYGHQPGIIEATVHTYNDSIAGDISVPNATTEYHTYGIELTPESIVWTIDDKAYHSYEKSSENSEDWPFQDNNHLYIILNLAMGGPAGTIEANRDSWRLEVKNLRFYEYTGRQ